MKKCHISRVLIERRAKKQLTRVPSHVANKMLLWIDGVLMYGILTMQQYPGFHDEVLKGDRRGQRSIRLSHSYRAIYSLRELAGFSTVIIEEVTKHDY